MAWTISKTNWGLFVENKTIVINTGPLILLDRIQEMDIPGKMPYRFICPQAVRDELDAGVHHNHVTIATPQWLEIKTLSSPISPIIDRFLDRGEAEVIQLAMDSHISRVCLDDLRGRKIAQSVGLEVMGLLALLGKAKVLGVVPRLRPITNKLLEAGAWYSQALIEKILAEVGE